MRYPAAETAEKHERILREAARLFRERGFADVSVAEIMKATGLTHGPFYNHFPSKQALMAEAVAHASGDALKGLDAAAPSEEGKARYLAEYLSAEHRDHPGQGCVIAALATEIGREPAVRPALTAHVKASIERMVERFPWTSKRDARGDAIRALTSMVGAVILARGIDDETLSAEILEAAARKR